MVPDVILEGQEVSVTARVVNQGPGPARQYSVDFSSDGVLFQSAHDSQAMESDSAANAQAKWIAEAGTHVLKASIEGVTPQDEDISNQEFQLTVVVDDFVDSQPPLVFITEPYQNEIVSD